MDRRNFPSGDMGIGALSGGSNCKVETIRYYERIGLLPAAPRSAGGHRRYDETHLRRLVFVRRCRDLGFSLDDVRSLLSLADGQGKSCAAVQEITRAHLSAVRRRLADLARLDGILSEMVTRCAAGDLPDCPVIDALFATDAQRTTAAG